MNKFWKGVLINIALLYSVPLIAAISGRSEVFLILPLVLSVIQFLVAMILVIFKKTFKIGQVMLAASGIVFLIGLGVCSMFPLNIH